MFISALWYALIWFFLYVVVGELVVRMCLWWVELVVLLVCVFLLLVWLLVFVVYLWVV